MASMIKVTPYDLLYNQNLIVNKIILEKWKYYIGQLK
jgi:hypothetical protein